MGKKQRKESMIKYRNSRKLSLQSTIIFVVVCATVVSLIVSAILIRNYVVEKEYVNTKEKIATVANLVAANTEVQGGITGTVSNNTLQDFSLEVSKMTNVDFVVVLNKDLIRLSHPDATVIGQPFSNLADAKKTLSGKGHYSVQEGVLGDGIRYFSPVKNDQGEVIGVVCVGLTLATVNKEVEAAQSKILIGLLLGLIVGVVGAIFLAQKVKLILFGLEPSEIATRLGEKEIIEDEVSEGIVAIDAYKNVMLVNREATQMFKKMNLQMDVAVNQPLEEHLYTVLFEEIFNTHVKIKDQVLYLNGLEVIASIAPMFIEGNFYGAVATFRDQSEMQHMIHELSGTQQYIDSLRAQTHEFMNKMHVILGLIELQKYEEVTGFIQQLSYDYQEEVGFVTEKIKVPAVAGFILGKINEAKEQDVDIVLAEASYLPELKMGNSIHILLQILGNLLDNAKEAVINQELKTVELLLNYDLEGEIFIIQVTDTGVGIPLEIKEKMFKRGFSTKGEHRGFGLNLIQKIVTNHQGFIEVTTNEPQGTRFYIELPYEMGEEE